MEHTGNRVLKTLFLLIWAIAITHVLAEYNFWYWKILWLDIPMHFIGGLWLGLAGLWIWNHTPYCKRLRARLHVSPITVALATGIFVGMLWELYEYVVWRYSGKGFPPEYGPDTALDLVMDTVGALVGVAVYRLIAQTQNNVATQASNTQQ